jgi:thiamine biosynthesis lipoprotein
MGVDLGGIGKGYALDRAAAVLRRGGIERALLDFGGETLSLGGWDVMVAHPERRLTPCARLAARDVAVSTSGQSETGIEAGGRRHGHVLDPATGAPIPTRASVTVVAASATEADALSTALLVMGRARAAEFATRHPELGVLWLEPGNRRVRAWKWNLSTAAALPGTTMEWMN